MKNQIFYGNAIALNYSLPADGSPLTVQLSPFGEFVLHDGGKMNGTVQHCTRAAFEQMVASWKASGSPDILVDVDHNSATGVSTEAAAWAKNLRVDDTGLCADFELTDLGKKLVEGKNYRFVSPGWTLAQDGTPLALCSVGLTNRPNLPVKPVVNSGEAGGRRITRVRPSKPVLSHTISIAFPTFREKWEMTKGIEALAIRRPHFMKCGQGLKPSTSGKTSRWICSRMRQETPLTPGDLHHFPMSALVGANAAETLGVLEVFDVLLDRTAGNAKRRDHSREGQLRIPQ